MICNTCNQNKEKNELCKESRNKSGVKPLCKSCNKLKCKIYARANKSRVKNDNLKARYGISKADYDKMFDEQNGVCKICKQPEHHMGRMLSVDHCHSTGAVRGLLCNSCNRGIGLFVDNPNRLRDAAIYLELSTLP